MQTEIVAGLLRSVDPSVEIETIVSKTTGDRDQRPFGQIGSKSLFVAEVEQAVLEGRADCAVHSAKDLTSELGEGCGLVYPTRASVHDSLMGIDDLGSLPTGAKVGTSSMRRRSLLMEARPDVEVVELRGNLETRLDKVARGDCDAAILAAAGLERLGLEGSGLLDPSWWIPAPGQGALAVEFTDAEPEIVSLLEKIDEVRVRAEVECERSFAATLEGGCSIPLGCLARSTGDRLVVTGYIGSLHGEGSLRDRNSGSPAEAVALGQELARAMLAAGGQDLLADARADGEAGRETSLP